MAGKRLLIVGATRSTELLRAAERRGLGVVLLTAAERPHGFACSQAVERVVLVESHRPPQAILRLILELDGDFGLAGIVALMEHGLAPAALAARRLGLAGPTPAAVQKTLDKRRMREVLAAAGLGQVRFAACRTLEELRGFQAQVGGPIVVKPVAGSGSDGVTRVERPEQAQAALELALSAPGADGALCEEFIEGPEISLEAYSAARRFVPVAVTDKYTDARLLETGHTQPSRVPAETRAAAWALAQRALQALGVTDTVTHTEMKLTPRGAVLVETHTRMGGGYIHALTARTTGVDLADVTVGLALGETPDVRPRATGRAAAVAFLAGPFGRVRAVETPPLEPGGAVVDAAAWVRPGDDVGARSASHNRLAHALAVAASAPEALCAAQAHLARMRFELAPDVQPHAGMAQPAETACAGPLGAVEEPAWRR